MIYKLSFYLKYVVKKSFWKVLNWFYRYEKGIGCLWWDWVFIYFECNGLFFEICIFKIFFKKEF